eukprot:gene3111-3310_t
MLGPVTRVIIWCTFISIIHAYSFAPLRSPLARKPLQLEIVSSAVIGFLPWLELHHIVVIKDPKKANGVYTLDFSPAQQQNWKVLGKLLLGQNVEGVVRVKWIPNEILSLDEIKHNCMCWDSRILEKLRKVVSSEPEIDSAAIERFVVKMKREWREYMNLYYHNCRHFSSFVFRKATEEFDLH